MAQGRPDRSLGVSRGAAPISGTSPRGRDPPETLDIVGNSHRGMTAGEGNQRAGFIVAGLLLVLLGWGVGVVANYVLHAVAPSGGIPLGLVTVYPGWSWYATFVLILGVFATLLGLGMFYLAMQKPRAPVHLPDVESPLTADTEIP